MLALALLLVFIGCVTTTDKPLPVSLPSLDSAQTGAARIEADVDAAASVVEQAKPHATETGRAFLTVASDLLKDAKFELAKLVVAHGRVRAEAEADKAALRGELTNAKSANAKLTARVAKVESSWGYIAETWIRRVWYVLLAALALGVVARFAGAFIPGPFGIVLTAVGTGILGVLSLGLSWIQSIGDNMFWRITKPKMEAA